MLALMRWFAFFQITCECGAARRHSSCARYEFAADLTRGLGARLEIPVNEVRVILELRAGSGVFLGLQFVHD